MDKNRQDSLITDQISHPERPLLRNALNANSLIFGYLESSPISWNQKLQLFQYKRDNLLIWHVNSFIIVFLINVLGSVWILLRNITSSSISIPLKNSLVFVGLFLDGGFCTAQILYRKDFTLALNELMRMADYLEKSVKKKNQIGKGSRFRISFEFGATTVTRIFATYPIALPVGAIFYELDPLHFLLKDYYATSVSFSRPLSAQSIIIFTLRVLCATVFCTETSKIFPFIITIFLCALRLCYRILNILLQLSNHAKNLQSLLMVYNSYVTIFKWTSKFQEFVTSGLMGIGLILSILFNLAMTKGFSLMPFYFYWYILSGGIIILTVIHVLMFYPYKISDASVALVKTLTLTAVQYEVKVWRMYYRKKVRATWPIKIYAGVGNVRLFQLLRSTEIAFFATIIAHTINLFISIPSHVFDNIKAEFNSGIS